LESQHGDSMDVFTAERAPYLLLGEDEPDIMTMPRGTLNIPAHGVVSSVSGKNDAIDFF